MKRNFNIIYFVLAVVAVVVTIASALNPYERDVHLVRDGSVSYDTGWEYKNRLFETFEPCTLPIQLNKSAYRNLTVRKRLGPESTDGTYIMYRSIHSENHVYVGRREVYTYGDRQSPFFPLPGSAWILVPLHDSYQGEYLTIELIRNEDKYGGAMESVVIGDRGDMLEKLLTENLFGLISCFIIAFASVLQ